MMIGTNDSNIQAYTELNCLLKHFPSELINSLPSKLLEFIDNISDSKYNIEVDTTKRLLQQNMSPKTQSLLAVLKYNFWSTDEQKKIMEKSLYENEFNYQEELSEKYSTDNLFINRHKIATESTPASPEYAGGVQSSFASPEYTSEVPSTPASQQIIGETQNGFNTAQIVVYKDGFFKRIWNRFREWLYR